MAWSRTNRNPAWVLLLQIICKDKTELSHPLTFKFFNSEAQRGRRRRRSGKLTNGPLDHQDAQNFADEKGGKKRELVLIRLPLFSFYSLCICTITHPATSLHFRPIHQLFLVKNLRSLFITMSCKTGFLFSIRCALRASIFTWMYLSHLCENNK